MIAFAYTIEAMILRHLVNQEQIILFMATIGRAFFLEGFGDTIWGSNVKKLPLDLPSGRTLEGEELEAFQQIVAMRDQQYAEAMIDVQVAQSEDD